MKGKQKLSRWEKIQYSSALNRFTVLGVSILIVEVTLGCWPVVATSIWGRHAVDTWIHFTYWVKAFWLFLAVFQSWCAPWKFKLLEKQLHQTRYIDLETQEEYRKHERKESLGFFRFFLGATASCELEAWMMISIFFHALLSFIILILVLVLKHEIASNTHWVLSVIFDAVAILESIGSPYVLTTFGVGPIMDTDPIFPETMVPPAPQYFVPQSLPPPPPPQQSGVYYEPYHYYDSHPQEIIYEQPVHYHTKSQRNWSKKQKKRRRKGRRQRQF